MAEPFSADDDAIIQRVGVTLLRELDAIAWFCDSGPDGRHALISDYHRRPFLPGEASVALVESGCIALGNGHCAILGRRMPYVRMTQTGRRILRRARALGIDLEWPEDDDGEPSHGG